MKKSASLILKEMPLKDLRHHPRNPRKHPKKGSEAWHTLAKSLRSDYFDPIVWNKQNGMLVSGHLRTKVLMDEGFTHADCVIVDYPEDVHIARMIAANNQFGDFEMPMVKDLLIEIDTGNIDMALSGFTDPDLERMMNQIHDAEAERVNDDKQVQCPKCGENFIIK